MVQKILSILICISLIFSFIMLSLRQNSLSNLGYSAWTYIKYGLIDYKNRVEMLNIIIKPYNNVVISTIEFEKKFDGTFQSLRELNHPVFACGDDCIDQISTWKEPKILLSENRFLVFSRNHSIDELKKIVNEDELLKSYSDHFEFVNLQLSNISSTNFRNLKSYEQLNEEVAEYIKKNNLYK